MIHDLEKQLNPGDPGKVEATYQASIRSPYGTPEEVANTVCSVLTTLPANITGAPFVVDGGRTDAGRCHVDEQVLMFGHAGLWPAS